jgi:triosephosphate isomerase
MKPLVIANWKLNPQTPKEAEKLFLATYASVGKVRGVDVVVCPPPLLVAPVSTARGAKKAVLLGAQDCFPEIKGAHTGESSSATLKAYGVSHVILGHSERRARGETDEQVAEKVSAVCSAGMSAVVCIGEHERTEEGEYYNVLRHQLLTALSGVKRASLGSVVVAYEPVWAIGKSGNEAMRPDTLQETVLFLKKMLIEQYGRAPAGRVSVLYGGSVKPENAQDVVAVGGVDGLLVGSASLDTEAFERIVKSV